MVLRAVSFVVRGKPRSVSEFLGWIESVDPALALFVLGICAFIEYIFPPFPGDTICLLGAAAAASSSLSAAWIFASLTTGAIIGGVVAYRFGVWLDGHRDRWPKALQNDKAQAQLERLENWFERYGAASLAINRFSPAFRSLFFVAAGLSAVRLWQVVLFGGISAALWNAGILAVGMTIGANLDALEGFLAQYQRAAWLLVIAAIVSVIAFRCFRGRTSSVVSESSKD